MTPEYRNPDLAYRWARALSPALLFVLAACGDAPEPPRTREPYYPAALPSDAAPPLPREDASPPPAGYTDGSGINEGHPDLTPAPLAADLEGTEAGARNVLLAFARAIELREYDQAWSMLAESAQRQWTKPSLNALFDGLDEITVAVPGGEMEGAAGSSYYTSHAEITATDRDGRPIRLEGPLVLRRVNDVPGATERQLRWQIDRIDLSQTH